MASLGSDPVCKKIKILMLGDSGVGKSSIINRWISGTFNPSLVTTLGVDMKKRKLHVDDKLVEVQVWDTAGQSAFHRITTSYYRGSNAILLVFDVSDKSTLQNVEYWMKNIKEHAAENVQIALIGNKVDLREKVGPEHCVRLEEGKLTAEKYKVIYAETSAMTSGDAVESAFDKIVRKVMSLDKRSSSDGSRSPESVSLFAKRESKAGVSTGSELSKISEDEHGNITTNPHSNGDSSIDISKEKKCVIS